MKTKFALAAALAGMVTIPVAPANAGGEHFGADHGSAGIPSHGTHRATPAIPGWDVNHTPALPGNPIAREKVHEHRRYQSRDDRDPINVNRATRTKSVRRDMQALPGNDDAAENLPARRKPR